MPFGSYKPYVHAPQRNEAKLKSEAHASGLFPKAGKSSQQYLFQQLERIRQGQEVSAVRSRRLALENRLQNQIELERMQGVLAASRSPNDRKRPPSLIGCHFWRAIRAGRSTEASGFRQLSRTLRPHSTPYSNRRQRRVAARDRYSQ